MNDLSNDAIDLLKTLKRIKPIKTWGMDFIDKRSVLLEYGYKQHGSELDTVFAELIEKSYIKEIQSGAYQLLAKGNNLDLSPTISPSVTNQFGDIIGSNVANMSPNVQQTLDLSSYSIEIQEEVAELHEAIKSKDDTRSKHIIDGLLVSAPALVLNLVQIGLSAMGGE